jgi:hypothetical protein
MISMASFIRSSYSYMSLMYILFRVFYQYRITDRIMNNKQYNKCVEQHTYLKNVINTEFELQFPLEGSDVRNITDLLQKLL